MHPVSGSSVKQINTTTYPLIPYGASTSDWAFTVSKVPTGTGYYFVVFYSVSGGSMLTQPSPQFYCGP
jgi:hypothetical protein